MAGCLRAVPGGPALRARVDGSSHAVALAPRPGASWRHHPRYWRPCQSPPEMRGALGDRRAAELTSPSPSPCHGICLCSVEVSGVWGRRRGGGEGSGVTRPLPPPPSGASFLRRGRSVTPGRAGEGGRLPGACGPGGPGGAARAPGRGGSRMLSHPPSPPPKHHHQERLLRSAAFGEGWMVRKDTAPMAI